VASLASVSIVSPDDQKVTFVELFFDLVFVFCVTQVVSLLHGHVDLHSAGSAVLVFWLVWWAWTQFTWALNAANTEHPRVRVITLISTAVAFFLAVGIPGAFGDRALWFAVPYVLVRVVGLLAYYWVARSDPAQRRAVFVFGSFSISGLVAVLVGAMLGGAAQYWCWAAAILLDLIAAAVGGQREGWNLHPDHFVERHGLIVIIALGETLIVAAAGLSEAPRTPAALATAILAVAVTGGLWWTYFGHVRSSFEHALAAADGHMRSAMARDTFSVLHFPLLCGVIAMAAATEAALAHPYEPLALDVRAALGAGAVLYVCGTAAAIWRATGQLLLWRSVIALATAIAVIAVSGPPWLSLSVVLAMLVFTVVVEQRHVRSHYTPS
jgi:low temperature requirement protein LtrA